MRKEKDLEAIGDFRSVDLPIIDRDIRDHDWEENDFNVSYTDSTDLFSVIMSQFNDPANEYAFVLNNSSRIVTKKLEGYEMVDPQLIGNRRDIFMDEEKNRISTGDLVLMRRPIKYRERADRVNRDKTKNILRSVLSNTSAHGIRNIESPFTE